MKVFPLPRDQIHRVIPHTHVSSLALWALEALLCWQVLWAWNMCPMRTRSSMCLAHNDSSTAMFIQLLRAESQQHPMICDVCNWSIHMSRRSCTCRGKNIIMLILRNRALFLCVPWNTGNDTQSLFCSKNNCLGKSFPRFSQGTETIKAVVEGNLTTSQANIRTWHCPRDASFVDRQNGRVRDLTEAFTQVLESN